MFVYKLLCFHAFCITATEKEILQIMKKCNVSVEMANALKIDDAKKVSICLHHFNLQTSYGIEELVLS